MSLKLSMDNVKYGWTDLPEDPGESTPMHWKSWEKAILYKKKV